MRICEMRILGVDENGLGPRLGPLVITGVLVEAAGPSDVLLANHHGPVQDSKALFRRDRASYAAGESVALAILGEAGLGVATPGDLALTLGLPPDLPLPGDGLPLWCKGSADLGLGETRVAGVSVIALTPGLFNAGVREFGDKFSLDLAAFLDLAARMRPFDLGLFGKVGGRKFYGPALAGHGFGDYRVVHELQAESVYDLLQTAGEAPGSAGVLGTSAAPASGSDHRLGNPSGMTGQPVRLSFARDADSFYLPVAAASVVGKYIRELSMLELNRLAGFPGDFPWCSGYPSDPKTRQLAESLAGVFPRATDYLRSC